MFKLTKIKSLFKNIFFVFKIFLFWILFTYIVPLVIEMFFYFSIFVPVLINKSWVSWVINIQLLLAFLAAFLVLPYSFSLNYSILLNLKLLYGNLLVKDFSKTALKIFRFALLLLIIIISFQLKPGISSLLESLLSNSYKIYMKEMIYIIGIYALLGSFAAFFVVLHRMIKSIMENEFTSPIILFLRKFKTKSDYILPVLLSGTFGYKFRIVELSSQYFTKTLLYLISNIAIISPLKRIIHPYRYVVEFHYSDDENWIERVESLIQKATYIFVDVSTISDNILTELNLVIKHKKNDFTFFTRMTRVQKKDNNDKTLCELRQYCIDIEQRLISVPYPKFGFQSIKRKKRMMKEIKKMVLGSIEYENERWTFRASKEKIIQKIHLLSESINKYNIREWGKKIQRKIDTFFYIIKKNNIRKVRKKIQRKNDPFTDIINKYNIAKRGKKYIFLISKMIAMMHFSKGQIEMTLSTRFLGRLDWVWILKYHVWRLSPSTFILLKARSRLGEEIFKELFRLALFQECDINDTMAIAEKIENDYQEFLKILTSPEKPIVKYIQSNKKTKTINIEKVNSHLSFEKKIHAIHPIRDLKKNFPYITFLELIKEKYEANEPDLDQYFQATRIIILFVLYDVKSVGEFSMALPSRLDWLWFLGYDLHQKIPDVYNILFNLKNNMGKEGLKEILKIVLVQISHLHRSKSTYKFTFLRIQKRERIQSELIESEIETKYIELMERIQPPEPPLSNQLSIDRTPSDESILQSPTQESNEVKIKDRIPPHHPIKILKDKLDLDEMVKCFTKKFGRGIIRRLPVPIDVLIRMMIILIIYNLRSERELMVKLPMRLDWMWFLGYEWGGKLPKTKSLVISRKYMGEEAFMELFTISFIHLVESRLLNGNVLFLNTFSAKNYNKSYLKVKYTNSDIYLKYEEFIQKLEYPKKNTKSLLVRFSDNMFQVRKNLETKGRCESAD